MATLFDFPDIEAECPIRPWGFKATTSITSKIDSIVSTLPKTTQAPILDYPAIKLIALDTKDPSLIAQVTAIESAMNSKGCKCNVKTLVDGLKQNLRSKGLIA